MLYLKDLRDEFRKSGDFVEDPHITDNDINLWLQQAFSKFWIRVNSLGRGKFITEKDLELNFDESLQKYFCTLPEDFFSLEEVYLQKNNTINYMIRSSSMRADNGNTDYNQNDKVKVFYSPDAPDLLEEPPNLEENPEAPTYQYNIPKFWKYGLIDYAIKRARMKQDDDIREIDVEQLSHYNEIIMASQNQNNHFPDRPTPYRTDDYIFGGGINTFHYAYFQLGNKLYMV